MAAPTVAPAPLYGGGSAARHQGRSAATAWREGALTRISELEALARWLVDDPDSARDDDLFTALFRHLELARSAAQGRARVLSSITGSQYERTASNMDAAEADLLQIAPDWYLRGQMPSVIRHVERHLPASDRRLAQLRDLAADPDDEDLSRADRGRIVAAHRAASSAATREHARVRSFRNVLAVASLVLVILAAGVAVTGFVSPGTVPLCFEPATNGALVVVCPTEQSVFVPAPQQGVGLSTPDIDDVVRNTAGPWDLVTVELIGLLAAAVAGAAGLRNIRGTSTPFALPVALAVLKLPTGALTAFLGLLLMRGGFVPGLSALDTSAQILAWAIVFGYAQQLFTRFVDQQARTVLDSVGGAERTVTPTGE